MLRLRQIEKKTGSESEQEEKEVEVRKGKPVVRKIRRKVAMKKSERRKSTDRKRTSTTGADEPKSEKSDKSVVSDPPLLDPLGFAQGDCS